ncbi:MAG: hypothetical protein AB9919_11440 [Geobacteraceae bacterium]
MQSNLLKILLVTVQLVALIHLQVPTILPLVGKVLSTPARGAVCYQDHRLCGCSAERIANKTCCCARSAEAASMAAGFGEKDGDDTCCHQRQGSTARHALMMAPCGAASPLFVSAVQDFLFVQNPGEISSPVTLDLPFFESPGSLCMGYFDPPDPPPRMQFFV